MDARGAVRFRLEAAPPAGGTFVAPAIIELDRARELKEEVFGPVLHVVRWRAGELDQLARRSSAANGYGLTLGIHSRIDETVAHIAGGCARQCLRQSQHDRRGGRPQPFGGSGCPAPGRKPAVQLSAPLRAEQVVTVNTAASGGNATLLAEEE